MDSRIIDKKLELLRGMATDSAHSIGGWQFRLADHLAPGKYKFRTGWQRTDLPAHFPAGKTVFLKAVVTIPSALRLANAYLIFGFQDLDCLLSLDGKPHAGLDWAHDRVPVPRTGKLTITIECQSMASLWWQPEQAGKHSVLSTATLCVVNREIEALCYDVSFAQETAVAITEPRRKALLDAAVEAALLAVDLTLPRERLVREVSRARSILRKKLAAIAPDPEAGGIYAVGHTHIDTAWLWPLRETVRKCGRTFSTACRLMERYPDFRFTCSQAQLYQYTKDHYPDVYRQIKKWVMAGRWETAGAMWIEADCNATSGESLVRQILHGLEFFRREFGTRPTICWLPDVFGYPSSLPEILAGCGVTSFYTYKLYWQAKNPFPHSLFRWRGLDGTEVLAHVVDHLSQYNNWMKPGHLLEGWNRYSQKAEYPEVIFPFGMGDGGGGVSEPMMEMFARAKGQFPGLPKVRLGTAEGFFAEVRKADPELPVWDGELYVETHRGTYTTHSAIKRANRQCELALRDAELFGSLATLSGRKFPAADMHAAWTQTLLHQFHDILPGSSIGEVYAQALPVLERVQTTAQRIAAESLEALQPLRERGQVKSVCVFNSLAWSRTDLAEVTLPDRAEPLSVVSPTGTQLPAQVVARRSGKATVIFHANGVPALGYAVFAISNAPAEAATTLSVTTTNLENRFFRITLNRDGGITRLYDKLNRREVLAQGAVGNDLQLLQDGPEQEDAWNVHATSDKRRYPFEGQTSLQVMERGPVRGMLRVRRTHRQSTFEQDIAIYAESNRIDFVTRVDWQERQTMLKVAFPLQIRATRAAYEVQFGACERPTHRNTAWDQQKFEVPAQQWADLSEAGYGVSLLNDSRYGYDAKDNVLRLTLLRSTTWPDPEADRGRHTFTYALLPHAGGWVEGETVRRAWELNVPVRASALRIAEGAEPSRSFIQLTGAQVVIQALKPAADGRGLILRFYEPHGARGDVTVSLSFPVKVKKVRACNLVEEDGEAVALRKNTFRFAVRPFQIRTFRLDVIVRM